MSAVIAALAFVLLAPLAGGILAGVDRIVTARMQARVGPPVFQPFWDVQKLFSKRGISVNSFQVFYAACFLLFMVLTGAIFFAGGDLLLVIFALTVAGLFLVMGGYSPSSPYSTIGAERELLQMMAYEPMLLISAMGFYAATKSFRVEAILDHPTALVMVLPGIFIGFLFVLTIKLRKSPFDLSTSHHGHQELVKGLTTEFSGPTLGLIEVAHWYENIMLLGFIWLFFAGWGFALAGAMVMATYMFEVLIDNVYARLTWKFTIWSAWAVTLVLGVTNLLIIAGSGVQ